MNNAELKSRVAAEVAALLREGRATNKRAALRVKYRAALQERINEGGELWLIQIDTDPMMALDDSERNVVGDAVRVNAESGANALSTGGFTFASEEEISAAKKKEEQREENRAAVDLRRQQKVYVVNGSDLSQKPKSKAPSRKSTAAKAEANKKAEAAEDGGSEEQ